MMTELSLNVLDIAENSIRANASLIEILIDINRSLDRLTIIIKDNGCGMSEDQIASVTDPFFTTRTTRNVGLGIPFFKMAAELSGGEFSITSNIGIGTTTKASFLLSSIDRVPLGDINCTIHTLITFNSSVDFIYTYRFNEKQFILDTREFREILGNIPFNTPDVSIFINDFLKTNKEEIDQGISI